MPLPFRRRHIAAITSPAPPDAAIFFIFDFHYAISLY
jgi:hypothetical protein